MLCDAIAAVFLLLNSSCCGAYNMVLPRGSIQHNNSSSRGSQHLYRKGERTGEQAGGQERACVWWAVGRKTGGFWEGNSLSSTCGMRHNKPACLRGNTSFFGVRREDDFGDVPCTTVDENIRTVCRVNGISERS